MPPLRRDLLERHQHEAPLVEPRMRQHEIGRRASEPIVVEQVEIECTGGVAHTARAAETDENHRRASSTALGLTRDLSGTTLSHIFDLAGVIDDFLSGRAYRDIYRRRQPIFRGSWAGFRYRLQATARSVSLERASDPRVLLHGAGGRPRILADPAAGRLARL